MTWCKDPDCVVCAMLNGRSSSGVIVMPPTSPVEWPAPTEKPKAPVLDDGDADTIDQNEVKRGPPQT